MKNKVKIVTALLITALCTTSAYAAENIIKNDSFETELLGTNGWLFSICHNHKYSSVMAVPKKLMKMKTLPIVQQTKCTAVKRHFISTVPLLHRELN